MDSDETTWKEYSTAVKPGDTESTSGNEIIELDVDMDAITTESGAYTPPNVDDRTLGSLANILSDISAYEQSARLEIERRHTVENESHTIRFTASELTDIVTSLAIAKTVCTYSKEFGIIDDIHEFGRLITESHDRPMDGSANIDIPGVAPSDGSNEIDPFSVIGGVQTLVFVDENGNQVSPKDLSDDRLPTAN